MLLSGRNLFFRPDTALSVVASDPAEGWAPNLEDSKWDGSKLGNNWGKKQFNPFCVYISWKKYLCWKYSHCFLSFDIVQVEKPNEKIVIEWP